MEDELQQEGVPETPEEEAEVVGNEEESETAPEATPETPEAE